MRNPFLECAHALGTQNFLNPADMQFALLLDALAEGYDLLTRDDPRCEWTYPDDAISEAFARLAPYRDRHFWAIERIMQRYSAGAKYRETLPR